MQLHSQGHAGDKLLGNHKTMGQSLHEKRSERRNQELGSCKHGPIVLDTPEINCWQHTIISNSYTPSCSGHVFYLPFSSSFSFSFSFLSSSFILLCISCIFYYTYYCMYIFLKYSTNVDTYTHMSTHHYEHMHIHHTPMSNSGRLSRLDLEIHEVGHQKRLTVDRDVASY
jgi:hypothetical protein